MKKQKNFKNQRGITLVALIITIIVLVILAAVAINVALNTGIINFASKGVTDYAKAGVNENRVMNKTIDFMTNAVDKIEGILGETGGTGGGKTTLAEAKEKDTPFTKTTEVKDGDKSMWVPAGFKITEGDSIDTGIVVQDKAKNEFVWVPVEDPSTMYGTDKDGNKLGKLYNFTIGADGKTVVSPNNWTETEPDGSGKKVMSWTSNSGYREPDIVSYDTSNLSTAGFATDLNNDKTVDGQDFKIQLQNEFESMIASVEKYKGFYIGRYETGNLKASDTMPVVVKENSSISNVNWYWIYKNSKEIAKGALTEDEKTQNKTPSVTSNIIWGCQWDAVMNWMKDEKNSTITEGTKYYVTNSTGMGYYNKSSKTTTGSNIAYAVKNIYDMAGNTIEWTMEAISTGGRVVRGGCYKVFGSAEPCGFRGDFNDYPIISTYSFFGSRIAIYVNL